MKTLRLPVDPAHLDSVDARQAIARAAKILRNGGLVALPTETVYGLGANALDASAVARIFAAKQRPAWDPIIVHIAGPVPINSMLDALTMEISAPVRKLMTAFWPGPLTLLLPRNAAVPDAVTAGRPLVGVRMPAHPVALELIRQAGVPIAAPSANLFAHTSPTTAAHVLDDLDGRIDAVLDAGPAQHGVESTVLDPGQSPMMIYRPGAITAAQIRDIGGPVTFYEDLTRLPAAPARVVPESLPSPGVGIRHYAPHARVVLMDAALAALPSRLSEQITRHPAERIGVLLPTELSETVSASPGIVLFPWGNWASPGELAHNLYAGLRALDAQGCTVILCPLPPADGLGAAIRDRLVKAADESV
ncbi:MAG: L-threonylcarbamoyladenylate synthase [Terracidiphilus sp.]